MWDADHFSADDFLGQFVCVVPACLFVVVFYRCLGVCLGFFLGGGRKGGCFCCGGGSGKQGGGTRQGDAVLGGRFLKFFFNFLTLSF